MTPVELPFPYQLVGARYLANTDQGLLADEMGLGKSCQAVIAADMVGARNILVLCPAAVRINWQREFERFSPLDRPCAVLMTGRDAVPRAGVVVCSYDLLANETLRAALKSIAWDVLVLDEAHYLKERSAKRTKAVYGHRVTSPGLVANAKRTWRLTGTPAPNDASELYTHLKSAGIIEMPYWDFVFRYCSGFDSGFGFKITGHKNVDELKQLLGRFMLRRKKEEVMTELPPITYQEVTVERTAVDLKFFFEQLRFKTTEQFHTDLKVADSTLKAALLAIKQSDTKTPYQDRLKVLEAMSSSMTTLRRYLGLAKLKHVCDILEEELSTRAVEKLVIFAIHRDVIEECRLRFQRYGAVTLYGGTNADTRQKNIDKFQNNPKCRVFIGNIQAAGTGITLTAAHEVAFIEADWVPANNAQAAMRCHRIGQTKPVRVRFFSCAGSVDEDVMNTLRRKAYELSRLD